MGRVSGAPTFLTCFSNGRTIEKCKQFFQWLSLDPNIFCLYQPDLRRVLVFLYFWYSMGSLRGDGPHNLWMVGSVGGRQLSPPGIAGASGGKQPPSNMKYLMPVSIRFLPQLGRHCIKPYMKPNLLEASREITGVARFRVSVSNAAAAVLRRLARTLPTFWVVAASHLHGHPSTLFEALAIPGSSWGVLSLILIH